MSNFVMKVLPVMIMHLCYMVSTLIENFLMYKTYCISRFVNEGKEDGFIFISMVYSRRNPLIKALAQTGMMKMSRFKNSTLLGWLVPTAQK